MTKQEATADRLFSRFIRERDGACQLADMDECWGELHAHHWIGRSYHATRYMAENGVCLCAKHHLWVHEHPLAAKALRSERLGPAFPVLWEKAQHGFRPNLAYVIANLRDELVR